MPVRVAGISIDGRLQCGSNRTAAAHQAGAGSRCDLTSESSVFSSTVDAATPRSGFRVRNCATFDVPAGASRDVTLL